MAQKKILLFIVEGPTEEISLSTVLSRIFTSDTVKFQVVHGDIFVHDFPSSDKIKVAVNEKAREFRGSIYKPSDICHIVHLVDMDGAYIPDSSIQEDHGRAETEYPYYTESQILTPKPTSIIQRNETKRNNVRRMSATGKVGGIPYSLYYFSSNLEHVLHNCINLSNTEKTTLAANFDFQFGENPDAFISFMRDSDFAVKGSYHDTWEFIKQDLHSLQRFSNFWTCLPTEAKQED